MKKLLSLLAIALAFTLSTPIKAAEESITLVNLNEEQVTYNYTTPNPVTNGRVAVTFNENELTLVSVTNYDLFTLEDVNQDEEAVDGMKTIYFAFASGEAYLGEDVALTLVFDVADNMEGKDITIATEVEEMNNEDEVVEVDDTTDVISIPEKEQTTDPEEPDTPVDPENPTDPEEPVQPEQPGDSADTSDDSNIELYLGLSVVALLAIAVLVFKRKKAC